MACHGHPSLCKSSPPLPSGANNQLFFASMTLQYGRQLADPSLVRTRQQMNQQNQQAYPLQPQGGFYPPPPLNHQDSEQWPAPPYSGPPPPPPNPYDKSDYHPQAEWANTHDEDPFRSSPGHGVGGSHDAEERAWERARTEGVTAHLTGQASPRGMGTGVRDEENPRGFVVPNEEEDAAWDEARKGGVTAHLTGGGKAGGL
jgi:hypothetical protein